MSSPDGSDGGDGGDDGPDDGPDDAAAAPAEGGVAEGGERKRRRRRRRRGGDREDNRQPATGSGQPAIDDNGKRETGNRQPAMETRGDAAAGEAASSSTRGNDRGPRNDRGGDRGRRDDRAPRADRPRDARRPDDNRGPRGERGRGPDQRGGAGDDVDLRGDGDIDAQHARGFDSDRKPEAGSRKPDDAPKAYDDDEGTQPSTQYGHDDEPAQPITLASDLPADAPADDPDPLSWPLLDGPGGQLGEDVASVIGVRFVAAGRIQWCDAGNGDYMPGERVIVDSDRGQRLATVEVGPQRRSMRERNLRRVIRRANDLDLGGERSGENDARGMLRSAKDIAERLRLALKVSRVEKTGGKLLVYYTSDERVDIRDFVRDLAAATSSRIELRQLGARDEAKVIGGIGSCGLTLCCTTWLPEFVPVSIKMAKDQGLVLSPTKVAGQCGRLKCCLVYEQAGYAELRKGLPKLGKRVITAKGEGRVVEVDVLRQRLRVAYAPGESEVLPATDVKPMFPPQGQKPEPDEPESEASEE